MADISPFMCMCHLMLIVVLSGLLLLAKLRKRQKNSLDWQLRWMTWVLFTNRQCHTSRHQSSVSTNQKRAPSSFALLPFTELITGDQHASWVSLAPRAFAHLSTSRLAVPAAPPDPLSGRGVHQSQVCSSANGCAASGCSVQKPALWVAFIRPSQGWVSEIALADEKIALRLNSRPDPLP